MFPCYVIATVMTQHGTALQFTSTHQCCIIASVWHVGCRQRPKQRRAQRHTHRHNGLHCASIVQRHGVPPDVGRVWVGKQGRCQHQHHRSARISGPHHSVHQHEVPHSGEGVAAAISSLLSSSFSVYWRVVALIHMFLIQSINHR